jgi:hypothetical protein
MYAEYYSENHAIFGSKHSETHATIYKKAIYAISGRRAHIRTSIEMKRIHGFCFK